MDINKLTLDEKIGQMIIAGFPSKYYDEHLKKMIEEFKLGNVVLFGRNFGSIDETIMLMHDIQENTIKNTGIPSFIGADQEGGMVTRLREGTAVFPGNMAVGAANVKGSALKGGEIVGEVLRAAGINLNIAPVLDVNNNPKNPIIGPRSYGDNPEKVAEFGADYIKGLQSRGVVATAKHFPGHGDTAVDTHKGMPTIEYGMDRLRKVELYPFTKAIEAGVDAIMTAHILFREIDKEGLPATLSYSVLTGLLRREMGFQGLILTDCMEMDAIIKNYGIEKGSVLAVNAGADIICISHHMDVQIRGITAIKNAVLNGEISYKRIDESVQRIINMKEKYGLFSNPYPDIKKAYELINRREYLDYSQKISEKSITLVRDEKKLIPAEGKKIISISTEPTALTGAEDAIRRKNIFCEAVKNEMGGEAIIIPINPDNDTIKAITEKCKDADRVIVGLYNAIFNQGQSQLIESIKSVNSNIIAVLLRSPYDISICSGVSTCICVYEYSRLSIESTIKVLKGSQKALGKLPVQIQ